MGRWETGGIMVKRIIAVLLVLILLVVVYTRIKTDSDTKEIYTENNTTQNIISQAEVKEYFESLTRILGSNSLQQLKDFNDPLIANSVYEEYIVEDNGDIDNVELSDIDINDIQDKNSEYPIVDKYGRIYRFGSKDESDESYKIYNSYDRYSLLYSTIEGNRLNLKIFDRKYSKAYLYYLVINEDKQIISYKHR